MDKIIDWITGLPKAIQMLLAAVVFGLLGCVVYFAAFGGGKEEVVQEQGQVLLEVPDASLEDQEMSRVETYRREGMNSSVSASDFWNQLEQEGSGGLLVDVQGGQGQAKAPSGGGEEFLDPSVYSELEIYYIRNGVKTKAQVDAEHVERDREEAERKAADAARSASRASENSDSAYFARMERAYQLAMKYSTPPEAAAPAEEEKEESADEGNDARHIVIPEPSFIPDDAMSGDGIISSLEQEEQGLVYEDGEVRIRPVKATFLKSEKVVAGQRVIMRLKEPMRLSDGTVIPANTHVSGICRVGSRLEIAITTVNYAGRIHRTDMSVYDNDGTEGIYCPVIEQKKGRKAAGRMAGQAATGLASTAATLFTGNPYVGRIASDGIRELSRTTLDDGSVAISVVAGYDFYIFENIKNNG